MTSRENFVEEKHFYGQIRKIYLADKLGYSLELTLLYLT